MKKIFLSVLFTFLLLSLSEAQEKSPKQALILVDIQQFYFPGGGFELVNPEAASAQAAKILQYFRDKELLVVHIKHKSKNDSEIHPLVSPNEGEKVIEKTEVSSFNGTDLHQYLQDHQITHVVVLGMMTHMCMEGTVRAAYDLGYHCTVISDACATRNLTLGDKTIKAEDVHWSTLSTLKSGYAKVLTVEDFLKGK